MNKILSIIIPSYNMERYLPTCLNSLVNKHMEDLDIIIVNDGSKDNTLKIAHNFESKYPTSVTVIDKYNGNYGSCINAALSIARGKYIKVLDADDSFDSENFSEFIEFLKNVEADLIISDYAIVDENGNLTKKITLSSQIPKRIMLFSEITDALHNTMFQMHAVTYNKEIFNKINYKQLEGISYTDQQWMFLPMIKVNKVAVYPHVIYRYLIGREGQTVDTKVSLKTVDQTVKVLESMLRDYQLLSSRLDKAHRAYLQQRIRLKAPSVYRIYLLKQSDYTQWARLKKFDGCLKESDPEIYDEMTLQTVKILPFHYISYWRNNFRGKPLFPLNIISFIVRLKLKL